jgi:hypothetical protein
MGVLAMLRVVLFVLGLALLTLPVRAGDIPGSWTDRCQPGTFQINNSVMMAVCARDNGAPRLSALDISTCGPTPHVGVNNGRLVCEDGPATAVPDRVTRTVILDPVTGERTGEVVQQGATGVGRFITLTPGGTLDTSIGGGGIGGDPPPASNSLSAFVGSWAQETSQGPKPLIIREVNGTLVGLLQESPKFIVNFSGTPNGTQLVAPATFSDPTTGQSQPSAAAVLIILQPDGTLTFGFQGDDPANRQVARRSSAANAAGATAPVAVATGELRQATVTSGVNVRTGPSSNGTRVLLTLEAGTNVDVRCQGRWCQLEDGGWVFADFLRFGGTVPAATAPAPVQVATVPEGASFTGRWVVEGSSVATIVELNQEENRISGVVETSGEITTRFIGTMERAGHVVAEIVLAEAGHLNPTGKHLELTLLPDGNRLIARASDPDGKVVQETIALREAAQPAAADAPPAAQTPAVAPAVFEGIWIVTTESGQKFIMPTFQLGDDVGGSIQMGKTLFEFRGSRDGDSLTARWAMFSADGKKVGNGEDFEMVLFGGDNNIAATIVDTDAKEGTTFTAKRVVN